MAESYSQGYSISQFSKTVIDLQSKSFCCEGGDDRKLIRFFKNTPGVYQGKKVLFNSTIFDLSNFYQEIENLTIESVQILSGSTTEISLNSKFLFLFVTWPADSLKSKKNLEIGLKGQIGIDGQINEASEFQWFIIKDIFMINTEATLSDILKINNATSPYNITIHILQAN